MALEFTSADPRIEQLTETGCWIWVAGCTGSGYGAAYVGEKQVRAHRAFYEHAKGPIPPGLDLDHLCRVRTCVNPDHLRACTRRDNLLAPGSQSMAKMYSERVTCPKCGSNEWTRWKEGHRRCAPCRRALKRRLFHERHASQKV